MAKGRGPTIARQLLLESREAAMNAVQTFNNPLTTFKADTFIVLMSIAWTYLLHAHFRTAGVEYRYYEQNGKRRKFHRTKAGAFKYWSLEDCLNHTECPLDETTKLNLRFLRGLRNEIEHHKSVGADRTFSARFLACCLNYERYVCELFGEKYSLGDAAAFTLQFRDLTLVPHLSEVEQPLPSNVAKYVQDFESGLDEDVFNSPQFSYRMLFVRKLAGRKGQADQVVEFVPPDSEATRTLNDNYSQIILKEVELAKHRAKDIVDLMHDEGYSRFNMYHHTQLWKKLDGKNPGKGFGVEVVGTWYWYDRWIDEVRRHCRDNSDSYRTDPGGHQAA